MTIFTTYDKAWKPLEPGDKIAVVNACMIDSQKEFHADAYKELFTSWGYEINGDENWKPQASYGDTIPPKHSNSIMPFLT